MTWLLDIIPRALLWLTAVPALLFLGFYVTLSRWWQTDVGRIIVGLWASLLAIIGLSLSRAIFGDWPGLNVVRVVLYGSMNVGLWHMFFTLRRIQRTRRDGTLDPPILRSLMSRSLKGSLVNTNRASVPAREPALSIGSISALVSAVLALLVVLGLALPEGFEAALLGVIAAAGPIVAAIITRSRVTPTQSVVEQRDGSTVVAGAGHDTIPEGEPIRAVHE